MTIRNPFDGRLAGRIYAKGRPGDHGPLVSLLRERLGLAWPVPVALDVGCGTGRSTVAIRVLARSVLGVDISRPMLAEGETAAGVRYLSAAAEALPLRDRSVSLLTCGAAFHWFRPDAFLSEARRVLRSDGAAVIYDNFFSADAPESRQFFSWYRESFLAKFPKPPRHSEFSPAPARDAGFDVRGPERCGNSVTMSIDDLANYLVTQSNVLAALSSDRALLPEVEAWLRKEVKPLFGASPSRSFSFSGPVWFLKLRSGC